MSFPGRMSHSNVFAAGKLASVAILYVLCAQPFGIILDVGGCQKRANVG